MSGPGTEARGEKGWRAELVQVEEAITWKGVFANQSVVCRLRDRQTLERLAEALGAPETAEVDGALAGAR